jgi:hypothetical protein
MNFSNTAFVLAMLLREYRRHPVAARVLRKRKLTSCQHRMNFRTGKGESPEFFIVEVTCCQAYINI